MHYHYQYMFFFISSFHRIHLSSQPRPLTRHIISHVLLITVKSSAIFCTGALFTREITPKAVTLLYPELFTEEKEDDHCAVLIFTGASLVVNMPSPAQWLLQLNF